MKLVNALLLKARMLTHLSRISARPHSSFVTNVPHFLRLEPVIINRYQYSMVLVYPSRTSFVCMKL